MSSSTTPEPPSEPSEELWTLADDPDDEGPLAWPQDPGDRDRTFRS